MNTSPDSTPATNRGLGERILKAGAAVLAAHLCLKLVGPITKNIITNQYGLAVNDVFTLVYETVLGTAFQIGEQCLGPAYLPVFASARNEAGEKRAWRYTSILFNLQFLLLVLITVLLILFPEQVIEFFTRWDGTGAWRAERRAMAQQMLPYITPGLLGMSLASLTYMLLNGYKEFFFAAFGDTVLKLSILGGALLGMWLGAGDWRWVAGGAVAGGTLKLLTHLFALGFQRLQMYAFSLDLSDPYVKSFFLLVLPLLAGILVSRGRDVVMMKALTSEAGLPTYFSMGKGVVDTISFLVPYTLSIALLPFFCDLSLRNDNRQLGEVLTKVIRMLTWLLTPVAIVLSASAMPIAIIFYSGKELASEQLQYPALVTQLYCLQLPFAAMEMMVMQAFFSSRRMIAPTIAGLIFSSLAAGIAYFGVSQSLVTTAAGILILVSLCRVLAQALKSIVLLGMLKWSVPVLPLAETAGFVMKLAAAGTVTALATYATRHIFTGGRVHQILQAALTLAVGSAVYLAASLLLKMEEPRLCWRWTLEKLKRRGSEVGH